jgi:hydroxymethylbilane synthase
MRRQCQLLARRPDLNITMLRGNVPTRIKKLDDGQFDAIVLAAAGLTRLGMADRITQLLPLDISVPAVAQGVLGLETRTGDAWVIEIVRAAMHDVDEEAKVTAERSFLARMGGSCQTPLAAHAIDRPDGGLRIVGMCGMPDGSRILRAEIGGPPSQAAALGTALANDLLAQGAADILSATQM